MVAKTGGNPNTSEVSRRFGAQLAEARSAARLSARELQDVIKEMGGNLSRGTIAKIEAGVREVTLNEVFVIGAALGITPFALLWPHETSPDDAVAITDDLSIEGWRFRAWLLGLTDIGHLEARYIGILRFQAEMELLSTLVFVREAIWYATNEASDPEDVQRMVDIAREQLRTFRMLAASPSAREAKLAGLPLYGVLLEDINRLIKQSEGLD